MKQEINLEEIANTSGIFRSLMDRQMQDTTLTLMKEACNQVLDLATENAYVEYIDLETKEKFDYTDVITDDGVGADISKQSILQIKDWIK